MPKGMLRAGGDEERELESKTSGEMIKEEGGRGEAGNMCEEQRREGKAVKDT